MNRDDFKTELERFVADFATGALAMFDDGCAHETCIGIGISIAQAKLTERQRKRAALAGVLTRPIRSN
jgi:hypothetical protein